MFKTEIGANRESLKENRMSSYRSDIEVLRSKYEQFIRTASGKEWIEFWRKKIGSNNGGDFGDFLYDFYPEMLQ